MFTWLTFPILKYIAAALAVAVLGLSVALWAAGVRIDDVKNQRDAQALKVQEAQTTIKGQVALLTECDRATKALKAESDKKASDADEAVRRAKQEAARYVEANKRRAALLAGPTPSGAGCSQALGAIRRELRK